MCPAFASTTAFDDAEAGPQVGDEGALSSGPHEARWGSFEELADGAPDVVFLADRPQPSTELGESVRRHTAGVALFTTEPELYMPDDDWELDDWEDEAFDEDVWDHSQLDLDDAATEEYLDGPEVDVVIPSDRASVGDDDGLIESGIAVADRPTESVERGGAGVGWSAWDVGTIFALGGWLADHHAVNTAEQVAAVLAAHGRGRSDDAKLLGASHPPPPSGYRYDTADGALRVGGFLEQGALRAELVAAVTARRELMIQAESPSGAGVALVLIISAVPFSSGPRLWVVAEEHTGCFGRAG